MNFDFHIGGYARKSYRLTLSNSELYCIEYYGIPTEPYKIVSIDGNEDWEGLMLFLSSCNWKRRYDSDILDGTQWELKAKGSGIRISSYGSNAYPETLMRFCFYSTRLSAK